MTDVMTEMKTCNGPCGRDLPLDAFDLKQRGKPWRMSRCRKCKAEAASLRAKDRAERRRLLTPTIAEPFPHDDFLRWRELCCGYKSIRTGRYVRATNVPWHVDAYGKLEASRRLVVVMPPAHNKSTFYGVEYPTWRIMGDRDVRIAVVQKNADEAKKTIGAVEQRLSEASYYDFLIEKLIEQGDEPITHPLRAWFGDAPFKPQSRKVGETWGAFSFRVAGRRSGERDYSMQAFGVGGPIQGGRFDHIVLDDVQDPREAARFPLASADKLRWLEDVILGRISDTQGLTILGNHFSDEDFIARVIDDHPEFDVVEYPALIPADGIGGESEELVPLWSEYWTTEALEKKRIEVGSRTWSVTWMSDPAGSDEHATFRRPALEAARDESYRLGVLPPEVSDVFIGCDPAVAQSGHCALIALGFERKTKRQFVLGIFNEPGMRTWDRVADAIIEMGRPFAAERRLRSVVIELASTQESLINHQRLRQQLASLGAKVKTYKTRTGTGARSESDSFDITTLATLFDEDLVTLPYGGTYAENAKVDHYIDQLCAWRTDDEGHSVKHLKRDLVMASLFAESEAFALANRPDSNVKIRNQARVPRWARGRNGGFAWQERLGTTRAAREEQREHDEKVTRAQEMAQRIGPLN